MRLLTQSKPVSSPPPADSTPAEKPATSKPAAGKGKRVSAATTAAASAAAQPAAPVVLPDYTRPTTTPEFLDALQRRVMALEAIHKRKLTAGEYAIAIKATTGRSVEQWTKEGYVIEKCPCDSLDCKGWTMTPIEHHRTAGKSVPRDTTPVAASTLKDMVPATAPDAPVDDDWDEEDLQAIFKQMFVDGLLKKGKKDSTLIPPNGPVTWTHAQMLAFAYGFEMDDLLAYRGKPRELQRQLIERLQGLGYDILTSKG